MNTFINAARMAVIALLLVSLTAFGGNCNTCKPCAPKKCNTGCKLQPEPVKIRKSCDHPGYYKQVCHLEYEPCEGKVEEVTAMPVYKGCYDEQGNPLSNSGSTYRNGNTAYTNDVDIQVSVPSSYGRNTKRMNK
jgi:hypothetical protein